MAANTEPIFVKTPNNKGQTWTNSDTAPTTKDVVVAATDGTLVTAVSAASTDTSDRDFHLYYNDGTTDYLLGTVTVTAGAGNTGSVAALNLLDLSKCPALNPDGSLFLKTGEKLRAANVATVTSAKTITLIGLAANY